MGFGNLTNLDFEINNSDFIFSATILEKLDSGYQTYYRFEIKQIWKGVLENQSLLTSGIGGPDCGILLEKGQVYLIYAGSENGFIHTDRCSRTIEISMTGDLDYLNHVFYQTDYDTISLTKSEFIYVRQNLFNNPDSMFSQETSMIFFKDKLVTKRQLIGINPNGLTVEYRYFSPIDLEKIDDRYRDNARQGIIIVYDGIVREPIKQHKLIIKINKCTATNTRS